MTLGIRAQPLLFGGRADPQDHMDQEPAYQDEIKMGLTTLDRINFEIRTLAVCRTYDAEFASIVG